MEENETTWKKGHFMGLSPVQLVAQVGAVGVTYFNKLSINELIRIGWMNNPVVDKIYGIDPATGGWVTIRGTTTALVNDSAVQSEVATVSSRLLDSGSQTAAENLKTIDSVLDAVYGILNDVYVPASHWLQVKTM